MHLQNSATIHVMNNQFMRTLIIVLIVAIGGFGLLFLNNRNNDPEGTFYRMLEANLNMQGVSRSVTQDSGVQSLDQTVLLQTGENNTITGVSELSQSDGQSTTSIKTQSYGTPTEDFVRYTDIATDQTGVEGQDLDFSNVLGVWGRTSDSPSNKRDGELFGEATLGIVPFGKINAEQSSDLISFIKNNDVYGIDFSSVDRGSKNGRPTYIYHAQIKPTEYILMLKKFGAYIGTSQLDDLSPESFAASQPIEIDFEVDVWSSQLREARFIESQRKEIYGSYGAWYETSEPENTIPVTELQQLLQAVR